MNAGRASWEEGMRGLKGHVVRVGGAWGSPHLLSSLDPVLLCYLPACSWSVGRLDSVFRQKPRRLMQVSARPRPRPHQRVTPVHTGEPEAAPFCFLGILTTSPG